MTICKKFSAGKYLNTDIAKYSALVCSKCVGIKVLEIISEILVKILVKRI